jgi:hypothetical protein|tara:strand:+ start:395 stop:733 length:339 start_codon:yes stop_codon:yes gene_type:complete
MTPTQRSLKTLRADDYHCAIVERWNPHIKIRQDLFGFADLLCMKPNNSPLLVQVTSTGWSSRIKKILNEPLALLALRSGFEIEVHGWRKLKTNKNKQTIKIIKITEAMFLEL